MIVTLATLQNPLKETLSEKHFLVLKKLARFNLSQGVVQLCDSAIV
jgi:hypothetical protein